MKHRPPAPQFIPKASKYLQYFYVFGKSCDIGIPALDIASNPLTQNGSPLHNINSIKGYVKEHLKNPDKYARILYYL